MAESEYTQLNVARLLAEIEHVRSLVRFDVAANPESSLYVERLLKGRKGAAEVYLSLAERPKSQTDITQHLTLSRPTVSRICDYLSHYGLIRKVPDPTNPRQFLYTWGEFEQTLRVSRIAKRITRT
jgi:hypothetical protein